MSLRIELGGMRNMAGWVSLDNRSNCDFNIMTDEIPVPDNEVEYFYMSHVFEHIPVPYAGIVLKKIYNKLKPGGKIRIVTPDLEAIVKAYNEKDMSVFNSPNHQFGTVHPDYAGLGRGGCLIAQVSSATIGDENDTYLFSKRRDGTFQYLCTFSHVSGWDFEMLESLLKACGYKDVEKTDIEEIDPHKSKGGQLCVNAYK